MRGLAERGASDITAVQQEGRVVTKTIHIVLSVDIDRHSDAYIRKEYLPMFREQHGCRTPKDVRQFCQLARLKGLEVVPSPHCNNHDARGRCLGHETNGGGGQ